MPVTQVIGPVHMTQQNPLEMRRQEAAAARRSPPRLSVLGAPRPWPRANRLNNPPASNGGSGVAHTGAGGVSTAPAARLAVLLLGIVALIVSRSGRRRRL
jgi:hypothetical protein